MGACSCGEARPCYRVVAQPLGEIDDFNGVSSTVLTPVEHAACNAVPPGPSRQRLFMTVWTRKESCLNALGIGLSVDPSTFEAGTDSITIGGDVIRSVQVGSFEVGLCLGAWAKTAGTSNRGGPQPVR